MKKIKIVETWNRKQPFSSIWISKHENNSEWVMVRKIFVGPEWYQVFASLKGMHMNWLIKLWSKINNLI